MSTEESKRGSRHAGRSGKEIKDVLPTFAQSGGHSLVKGQNPQPKKLRNILIGVSYREGSEKQYAEQYL